MFPPFVFCILFGIIKHMTSMWGFPPGITSPGEECRSRATLCSDIPLSGKLFLVETPQWCHICIIYKYDIPVWCTTGITPPREECRPRATLLSKGSYSCCTPHWDVIFVLLYRTTYKTQKGENWQTPEILDKYSFVKNLQITITGIVALTHQSEREAPKRTTGENFQFDSEKFLKTWTNESTRCFASFFK